MQDQIVIIKEFLLGIWSKKHYIIISTWIICPIAWLTIATLPDKYQSESRVFVDTQSLLRPLMEGLMVETNPNYQIQLMVKTLLSYPNLERIARLNDLDIEARTPEEFEDTIQNLKRNISINSTGRENIFTIKSTQQSPLLAKNVVQTALNVFIENTLGENREDANNAHKFLKSQITEYEKRLLTAEAKVKNFRQEHFSSLPENTSNYSSALANEKLKLKEAELALLEAQTKLAAAKSQINEGTREPNLTSKSSAIGGNYTTEFDQRILLLEENLDNLLLRFTEIHPDVKETKARLEQLRQQRSDEIAQYIEEVKANPNESETFSTNPIYQEMVIQANQLEYEVASLTVRVEDYTTRISQLEQKILTIPEVDANFVALNRDYDIVKGRYEELLERYESAKLAQQADINNEKIQFRVIDPPKLPLQPAGPQRVLFAIISFLVSIAVGIGFAILMIQLNPKVVSTSQLSRVTNLPIFGVISATENLGLEYGLKRKRKLFILSNIVITIFLLCVIVYFNSPDMVLSKLRGVY